MRRLNFLLVVFLVFAIVIISETTTFGEEYIQYEVFADSDFSHTHNVCIDPGHGGPTAEKFGDNGDGAGTHGCCYGLSEQWVNLHVASA
jgi:N-acetylmuramoyl-L-alanine amidase